MVSMITKQELISSLQEDQLTTQFVRYVLDDASPTDIPSQHDENSIALLLLRNVSNNDRKNAIAIFDPISKRHFGEDTVWVSNDLFFIALAITSLKFTLHRDFVRSVADLRNKISAGGSHRGLAQAVSAAMTGKPDFTETAAIFSLVLTQYMDNFTASNRDILAAYDSLQSYAWDTERHSTVSYAMALRGMHDIVKSLDLVTQRGGVADLCTFAQEFPTRVSRFSRVIVWMISIVMMTLFVIDVQNSDKNGKEWIMLHRVFASGLGISSIFAILTLVPEFQKKVTKFILRLFRYPKTTEKIASE
jgi:hypothetical protein